MNKMIKRMAAVSLVAAMGITMAACSGGKGNTTGEGKTDDTIRIGCVATTETPTKMIKEAIEATSDKTVEIVMFDANNMPATALKDGDVEAIFCNHKPWIDVFAKENKADLQMVEPYFYFSPFRIFSSKYKSLDEIPTGATAIVPNDPSNMDRSLVMMEDIGFITLGEKTGNFYTILDIKENIKDIKITEVEMISTARSIADVDFVFATAYIAQETGNIDPNEFLYEATDSSSFEMGLIVRGEDVKADWAVKAMEYLKTDESVKKFNDEFNGAFTLYDK